MFSVLFEILPRADQRAAHVLVRESLVPELEQMPGYVDSVLYRSLGRDGWLLTLSSWRDEKSLVRWRTSKRHHEAQVISRAEMLEDYRFRICEVTHDTDIPVGCQLRDQRLDETETGLGTAITLIGASQMPEWVASHNAQEVALYLGFDLNSYGDCISWDVFEDASKAGDIILLSSWKDQASAVEFAQSVMGPEDSRVRAMRIVRDYSMFDRREAPQFFPDAAGQESIHA